MLLKSTGVAQLTLISVLCLGSLFWTWIWRQIGLGFYIGLGLVKISCSHMLILIVCCKFTPKKRVKYIEIKEKKFFNARNKKKEYMYAFLKNIPFH